MGNVAVKADKAEAVKKLYTGFGALLSNPVSVSDSSSVASIDSAKSSRASSISSLDSHCFCQDSSLHSDCRVLCCAAANCKTVAGLADEFRTHGISASVTRAPIVGKLLYRLNRPFALLAAWRALLKLHYSKLRHKCCICCCSQELHTGCA